MRARILLLREGAVIDEPRRRSSRLRKGGVLERWLYSLAYDQPAL